MSPNWSWNEMHDAGAGIVIYGMPCLFAAQEGIENELDDMIETGRLTETGTVSLKDCTDVLNENILLER